MAFWVYILRCADGSYYTGQTDALEQRVGEHVAGSIPGCHTESRRPVELIYSQEFQTREEALSAERRIKGWRREKKEALIGRRFELLPGLARTANTRAVAILEATGMGGVCRESIHGSTGSPRTEESGSQAHGMSKPRYPVEGRPGHPTRCESSPISVRPEPVEGLPANSQVTAAPLAPLQPGCGHTGALTESTPAPFSAADLHWMQRALALADRAEHEFNEVPVGAVLVDANGELLAESCNRTIGTHDPTAHAEIVALRAAGEKLGNYRLPDTTLYVTLEPCAMCAMALVHARVARVVFAAHDPKTGAAGSVFDLLGSERHNHRVRIDAGLLGEDAGARLTRYFRRKRGKDA